MQINEPERVSDPACEREPDVEIDPKFHSDPLDLAIRDT